MNRKIRKKYDRKEAKHLGIEEPIRKTMFDIVMENLRLAGRKTFLHRFIYVGRHTFKTEESGLAFFEKTINTNGIEPVTGLYIQYKNQFLHVIETDEGSILKHLHLLYSSPELEDVRDLKLLGDLNHINARLNIYWTTFIGVPRLLVNPPQKTTEETPRDAAIQVFNCINKLNRLAYKMYGDGISDSAMALEAGTPTEQRSQDLIRGESNMVEAASSTMTQRSSVLGGIMTPYRDFLPERELLDYLIDSPYTQDLKTYMNIGGRIVPVVEDSDLVWPIPMENVQYDIYKDGDDTGAMVTLQGGQQVTVSDKIDDEEEEDDDNLLK
ncbi:unnamed protein product [Phyllotreta striolata]|uniref:Uncharacterized protein n=1 Tax=Phyllotreta striolata TaxID=444603 RepID=A0A9N9U1S2_PHYSR|nr:unnamed protein product [Phyllotreta striolata]